MALSKTTQDHDEIRQWAEARGGKPAEVASTERNGETGIIRIEFPGAAHANDSALKEISWEDFFEKFDTSGLALIYQEQTADGATSNFNKLVHPENVSGSVKKSAKKGSAGKTSRKAAAVKQPAKKPSPAKTTAAKKSVAKAPVKKTAAKTSAKKAPAKSAAAKTSAVKTSGKKAAASAPKKKTSSSVKAAKSASKKAATTGKKSASAKSSGAKGSKR